MTSTGSPVTATAPGKIILFGEHAVVYGRPAIAVPVTQVNARATVLPDAGPGLTIETRDQGRRARLDDLAEGDPLAAIVRLTLEAVGRPDPPDALLIVESTIPIASGLGSGAAVSTAMARALARYLGHELDAAAISRLVFQVEKIHHGTPSGIDNTVIAHSRPVCFIRGPADGAPTIETLRVPVPFGLAIGDTGVPSPTRAAVGDVRRAWQADPARYDSLFDRCGDIARRARAAIEGGQPNRIGPLMIDNHRLLQEMGVSSPALDALVAEALAAGALGAKLSGAGRGGNMIALVTEAGAGRVAEALLRAGAKRAIVTGVGT